MSFTTEVLMQKVREMRTKQKEYFKTRDRTVLIVSKQLEKEVDDMLVKMVCQPAIAVPLHIGDDYLNPDQLIAYNKPQGGGYFMKITDFAGVGE